MNIRLAIAYTASVALNVVLFRIAQQNKKELDKAAELLIYCADMLTRSGYEFTEFDFLAFAGMGLTIREVE